MRKGRVAEAEMSLKRLAWDGEGSFNAQETVAMMVHTNELEKEIKSVTSYWDCFKGIDLRRTEVVCLVWAVQNLCGAGIMSYSTYFYEQAGLGVNHSFDLAIGQYGIGIVGTLSSWVLMTWFGRRTLYIAGLVLLDVILFIIGFIALAPASDKGASWATGSLLLVYTFFYDYSGPRLLLPRFRDLVLPAPHQVDRFGKEPLQRL